LVSTFHLSTGSVETSEFASVLCYPKPERHELETRLLELTSIGVDTLELTGDHSIGGARVLGKGCVGIVVKGRMGGKAVAVKIRRADANRPDMEREARLLALANSVKVGPRLFAKSKNVLVMEYIHGMPLGRWTQLLPTRSPKRRVRTVVGRLLDDCFKLDQIRLDHGELSDAHKNVLVGSAGRPRIVDFESASDKRRPSNVTSITQYLLIGGGPAKRLRPLMKWRRRTSLIKALQDYKSSYDRDYYERVRTIAGV
jgi:putative serine/threonine protein kinase